MRKTPRIDPVAWYRVTDAAALLDNEVTAATVKSYCRTRKVKGKQRGPKQEWYVLGSELKRLRKEWGLDS